MKTKSTCPACNTVLIFDRTAIRTAKCPKCDHLGNVKDFREVPMKNVECPHCKVGLKVPESVAHKDTTCPKCMRTIGAKNMAEEEEMSPTDRPSILREYRVGKLELVDGEDMWLSPQKIVTLVRGINTLGRKSPNSVVSIQLETSDSFMSRCHAKIEVKMTADSTFVHHLSDADSANGTYHNGDALEAEEIINLAFGDTIRMGQTTFKFVE